MLLGVDNFLCDPEKVMISMPHLHALVLKKQLADGEVEQALHGQQLRVQRWRAEDALPAGAESASATAKAPTPVQIRLRAVGLRG